MTPLGPGGQNGGAGGVATSLVKHIAQLRPDWDQVLLTSTQSHAELLALEADNVRCVLAKQESNSAEHAGAPRELLRSALQMMPPALRVKAKSAAWKLRHTNQNADLVNRLRPDLLFCPFSVPYYHRPGLPLVVILHELQHRVYPLFFSDDQRLFRERHMQQVARTADRIVCVSEYVRQTLLSFFPSTSERAVTIPHGLLHSFADSADAVLDRVGLRNTAYLLYPANFWLHKNHSRLFEALAIYRRCATDGLRLVCTGAPNKTMRALEQEALRELGPGVVVFAGYLDEGEFTALLDGCAALIYPSLYEGFGMPVLEAMARGKPVLCSNATSLPEVADGAAEYFDPNDVPDIARAIGMLHDRDAVQQRIRCGLERAARFGSAAEMSRKYVGLFEDVLEKT
jgi:glycosyltransferase involved in cell wall biosynthesis